MVRIKIHIPRHMKSITLFSETIYFDSVFNPYLLRSFIIGSSHSFGICFRGLLRKVGEEVLGHLINPHKSSLRYLPFWSSELHAVCNSQMLLWHTGDLRQTDRNLSAQMDLTAFPVRGLSCLPNCTAWETALCSHHTPFPQGDSLTNIGNTLLLCI